MDKGNVPDTWGGLETISGAFKTPAVLDVVGYLERHGLNIENERSKAQAWCEEKAASGDTTAKYILACLYAFGLGGVRDYEGSIKWCRQAVSEGHVRAMFLLATLLISSDNASKEDLDEANNLLELASTSGDLDARFAIALLALNGIGREVDIKFAISQMEDLVLNGYANARCSLAMELLKEDSVEAEEKAVSLILEAANANDPIAFFLLSNFYLSGSHGFPKDEQKSQYYTQMITKKGDKTT